MVNTSQTVVATVQTPGGRPSYDGDARDRRRARHGGADSAQLLPTRPARRAARCCPTGRAVDVVNGVRVTCIDNGMPVVVMRAADLGRTGYETRDALDADTELKARIEAIRLAAGPMMNLGDVTDKTVPKMILVSPPRDGGAISTRSFIPHRVPRHDRRVRGAERGHRVPAARGPGARGGRRCPTAAASAMLVEHPTGASPVSADRGRARRREDVTEGAIISTARALFAGQVLVPARARRVRRRERAAARQYLASRLTPVRDRRLLAVSRTRRSRAATSP